MRKGIVIDLDGTLMNTNTFHEYIVFVSRNALMGLRIDILMVLIFQVLLRKCRIITHERMKYYVLRKTCKYMKGDRLNAFENILLDKVNSQVLSILANNKNRGYYTCLSTAAPENYASIISNHFGFDGYCATSVPYGKNINWHENVREWKRTNTLDFLGRRNVELSILVTDHYDDLPLLRESKECNYLVNPSEKTVNILENNHIDFNILN